MQAAGSSESLPLFVFQVGLFFRARGIVRVKITAKLVEIHSLSPYCDYRGGPQGKPFTLIMNNPG
jgi:hypothetical protein